MDACPFISEKLICLTYVDDTLFFAKDYEDIDRVIKNLQKHMKLEVEDDMAGFLGVKITPNDEDGTVTMTQRGLTDRIVTALGCDDLEEVDTPAIETLGKDEFGDPPLGSCNFPSVMGMIWYLERHSRPDIGLQLVNVLASRSTRSAVTSSPLSASNST